MKSDVPIVVTGVGIHAGWGDSRQTIGAVMDGRCAIQSLQLPSEDAFGPCPAAPAPPHDLLRFLPSRKIAKFMSPATELAVLAAGRALEDAGLLGHANLTTSMGLWASTGLIAFDLSDVKGSLDDITDESGGVMMDRLTQVAFPRCNPLLPFRTLLSMPLGMVSIVYGIRGENHILYPGADQGGVCLERAVRAIRAGRCQRALVGGAVQGVSLIPILSWKRLGWLADCPQDAIPFSENHRGYAPCDVGAFLVLESEASACERGVDPYGTIDSVTIGYYPPQNEGEPQDMGFTLMSEACPGDPPDLLFATGLKCVEDDHRLYEAASHTWGGRAPCIGSFDGLLGYARAASVPLVLGLCTQLIRRREVPSCVLSQNTPDARACSPSTALVWSADPEGGVSAVHFSRAETGACS